MIYFQSIFSLVCYTLFNSVFSEQIKKKSDFIAFPEVEENLQMKNKQNRQPLFIPAICPENQLFYPGDEAGEWICDCRPGHIYLPKTDKCWPAYERGPCQINEYLVMGNQSAIPICVENPCEKDKMVVWKSNCVALGTTCGKLFPIEVVAVDAETMKINCVKLVVDNVPEVTM